MIFLVHISPVLVVPHAVNKNRQQKNVPHRRENMPLVPGQFDISVDNRRDYSRGVFFEKNGAGRGYFLCDRLHNHPFMWTRSGRWQ
ncbi:hypothetical protein GWI33_019802 [Rhynchophorus ferrugineus]|uniref:Uncharacterized protein n=1 Tax=Rhynchophorus ferrugineus TaxID=354439 RepID=A0A834HQL7_RHYFE|nr:hypothetical protein GWI33_019802 [Rhynchophorus ferrugineus]